jgi:hypothetical protein
MVAGRRMVGSLAAGGTRSYLQHGGEGRRRDDGNAPEDRHRQGHPPADGRRRQIADGGQQRGGAERDGDHERQQQGGCQAPDEAAANRIEVHG